MYCTLLFVQCYCIQNSTHSTLLYFHDHLPCKVAGFGYGVPNSIAIVATFATFATTAPAATGTVLYC